MALWSKASCGRRVDGEPADARVFVGGTQRRSAADQRQVRHRDAARGRVALRLGERIELLEVDIVDAGLLRQLARRRLLDGLAAADAAAGQRPASLVGQRFMRMRSSSSRPSCTVKMATSTATPITPSRVTASLPR